MAKRGPKAVFDNSKVVAQALREIQNNTTELSRFKLKQLIARGLVEEVPMHTGKRGRPAFSLAVTGKGRGFIALAANWK